MRFEQTLKLSSHLLILIGFYAILITGSYSVAVLIGIAVTLLHWRLGERLSALIPVPKWFWNLVAIVLILYFAYDSFFRSLDLVGNGIKFVVYLQAVKLLSPKTNRDQMQIYLLSFLHILASTVISNDIGFALPFLLYIIVATWTLSMFNLKLQLEAAVPAEKKEASIGSLLQSRNIITKNYLWFTSLLSISIIAFTMLVFFSFPRLSMGNFFKRVEGPRNVSGFFSEEVTLGNIGNIKLNNTITLRVEIDKKSLDRIDPERLYWRGTASDYFDGRKWRQTNENKNSLRMDADSSYLQVVRKMPWKGKSLHYRVFMEALNPPILFGADQLLRISWDKPMIERLFRGSIGLAEDPYGGLYFSGSNLFASDLTYVGESLVEEPPQDLLKKPTQEIPLYSFDDYLQLPDLDPAVEKLIRDIPIPADAGPYGKARAIVRFLERNYQYTINVQDIGVEDPLRFFFIQKKQGHCEYFSTALAMALRVHRVPSRNVVGFRGGELNPYGEYLAVRQSDAHSWVEAYIAPVGWIRLDPSPLDSTVRSREAMFRAVNQFFDFLRLRWNKYIIEYDLRSQAQIAERIGKSMSKWFQAQRNPKKNSILEKDPSAPTTSTDKRWVVLLGIVGLVVGIFLWRRRSKRQQGHWPLVRMTAILAKYGFEKTVWETPLELVRRVEVKWGPMKNLEGFVTLYYASRFGRKKVREREWTERLDLLKEESATRARMKNRRAA